MNKLYILIAIIASAGLTACGEFVGQERTINEFVFNPCQLTPASVADIHGAPDPLEDYQWYLKQEFANVTGAWGLNNDAGSDGGEGIQIGVVDDALQFDHEDLNSLGDVSSKSNINPHAPTNHPARNNPYPTG
ncbi:MAG: hypothetical protein HAW61_01875, partial [Candidatus Portiera sp.]|nr:hypothetical protein [Portiera sp.]